MKKIWLLAAIALLMLVLLSPAWADGPRQNASPVTTVLSNYAATDTYNNITFEYPTRDLRIKNNRSDMYLYVDLTSATNTDNYNRCYYLEPDGELFLYDFMTTGISLIWASPAVVKASDVTVLSVF